MEVMYTILLAMLLIGEALTLWAGMHGFSRGGDGWSSPKNNALLLLDAICGLYLLLGLIIKLPEVIFWFVFAVIVTSHALREYEYLSLKPHSFCSNLPLFMMNNIKLVLSMSTAVIRLTFI